MKHLTTAAAAVFLSTSSAWADGVKGGVEYSLENENIDFDLGYEYALPTGLILRPNVNAEWKDSDFNFNGVDLGAAYVVNQNVSATVSVNTDGDLEYSDTTIGLTFAF